MLGRTAGVKDSAHSRLSSCLVLPLVDNVLAPAHTEPTAAAAAASVPNTCWTLTLRTVGLGGTAATLRPSIRATFSSSVRAVSLSAMCRSRAKDTEFRCVICCPAASTRLCSCVATALSCAASEAMAACTSSSTVSAAGLVERRARRASSCCKGTLQSQHGHVSTQEQNHELLRTQANHMCRPFTTQHHQYQRRCNYRMDNAMVTELCAVSPATYCFACSDSLRMSLCSLVTLISSCTCCSCADRCSRRSPVDSSFAATAASTCLSAAWLADRHSWSSCLIALRNLQQLVTRNAASRLQRERAAQTVLAAVELIGTPGAASLAQPAADSGRTSSAARPDTMNPHGTHASSRANMRLPVGAVDPPVSWLPAMHTPAFATCCCCPRQ